MYKWTLPTRSFLSFRPLPTKLVDARLASPRGCNSPERFTRGWGTNGLRLFSNWRCSIKPGGLGKMEVIDDIVKSPQDKRKYRYIKFPNELRAVLVSDDTTEKASATLSVRVGGLCDPDDLPGLSHFCEHMLFLGTEKYPGENDYAEFVDQHGGMVNAYTCDEFTTYYFDVASDHLRGALDRFAQFFICPLFNEGAKDREVNAVESENTNYLQVDSVRFNQICRTLSRPGHPYRKFMTGNKQTLETHPKEKGIDVREALLKYHSSYYSSNIMTLAVVGKESLDELTVLIEELFSPVKNKSVPVQSFPVHPYSENETQLWLEYVPVKDFRQLKFEFPLPDLTEYYESSPAMYVGHLIGHEGKGSLLSLLRARGWCNRLSAGQLMGAKGYMFFEVGVDLTEEGEDHVEDIAAALFQYLAMLKVKGPQEWIFKEISELGEIDFRFREKQKPCSYTMDLAYDLNYYRPREVLYGGIARTYRPDLINQVMDHLCPQQVRGYFLSKKFVGKTEMVEPWYSSDYNVRKIDPELIEAWNSCDPIPELHLPEPNKFIPTDFDLVPRNEADAGSDGPSLPSQVKDSPLTRVWFKQDDTFLCPKADLCFIFRTPVAYQDPRSCAQMDLFIQLLVDSLKEFAYDAGLADIQYNISNTCYGFMLRIEGYNHKQDVLLSRIMSQMTSFVVDPKKFEIFKEVLLRHYKNFKADQPYSHASHYFRAVLASHNWTIPEIAVAMEGVTCAELQDHITKFFSHLHIEALLVGNLSQQRCLDLVKIVEEAMTSNLGSQPLLSPMKPYTQVALPDNSAFLYTTENEVHSSHCVGLYLQVGTENTRLNMLLELLGQILSEPCFNKLRTQEQLGYIVSCGIRGLYGVMGFHVLVQSDSKPSSFVEKRIEIFLLNTLAFLESLSDEDFEKHRSALAVKRSEKPKKLKEETNRYWREILTFEYHFDRDNVEVAYLQKLSKDDVIKFFKEHIVPGAPKRHKATIHVVPTCTAADKKDEVKDDQETKDKKIDDSVDGGADKDEIDGLVIEPTTIMDITEFKSKLSLHPTVEPYIKTTLTTNSS